jgi:hypothetical protein
MEVMMHETSIRVKDKLENKFVVSSSFSEVNTQTWMLSQSAWRAIS